MVEKKQTVWESKETAQSSGGYPLPEIEKFMIMEGQGFYETLKKRTKQFALRILKMARALPKDPAAEVIQKQVIRSGTIVGSNYRSACRAKSTADFIHKMKIVEEEADESMYWMELILEDKLLRPNQIKPLYDEANEILSIVVKSIHTARQGR